MRLAPCTITAAREFVRIHHRHCKPPLSGLFAVACEDNKVTVGVAIVGRCIARMLHDGYTAEVTRLCVIDGAPKNACSMLYSAAWRACRALGYTRLVTYTLDCETGISLQASGFRIVGQVTAGKWDRPSRHRSMNLTEEHGKSRWEITA